MDTRINPVRYPTLFRYLANLPEGLSSYPNARTLTDLCLMQARRYPELNTLRDLPEDVQKAILGPWQPNQWVPEVHLMCQSAVVRDFICRSDEAYLKSRYDIVHENFKSTAVRTMMSLLSPNLMALASAHRWSHFKQGSTMQTIAAENASRTISLTHMPNIYLKCMLDGIAKTFEAALSCSRATGVTFDTRIISPTETHFLFQWQSK